MNICAHGTPIHRRRSWHPLRMVALGPIGLCIRCSPFASSVPPVYIANTELLYVLRITNIGNGKYRRVSAHVGTHIAARNVRSPNSQPIPDRTAVHNGSWPSVCTSSFILSTAHHFCLFHVIYQFYLQTTLSWDCPGAINAT